MQRELPDINASIITLENKSNMHKNPASINRAEKLCRVVLCNVQHQKIP